MAVDRREADLSEGAKRARGRPAVGRDTPLTEEEILATADQLVLEEGIDALSMRNLAQRLGVTPMAIYHYVPNKPALVWALCERVWRQSQSLPPPDAGEDLLEWFVGFCLHTRRLWIEHLELAPYVMAVPLQNQEFITSNTIMAVSLRAIGFRDPGLTFASVITFLFGSVATTANRHTYSAYFGRDPDALRAWSLEQLGPDADPDVVGVIEARFDEAIERHFEAGLRALLAGLLAD